MGGGCRCMALAEPSRSSQHLWPVPCTTLIERGPMPNTLPPDQAAYYEQVWHLARQIPQGKVATYGQIAQMLPSPAGVEPETYKASGPRWVGSALAGYIVLK